MLPHAMDYTWTKCFLWGVSTQHFFCSKNYLQKKEYVNSVKHFFIGCVEAIPLVGQIISVAERWIFNLENQKNSQLNFPNVAKPTSQMLCNGTINSQTLIHEKLLTFQQQPSQKEAPKTSISATSLRETVLNGFASSETQLAESSSSDDLIKVDPKISPLPILPVTHPSPKNFVGLEALKKKQKEHLHKLQKLADQGQWRHLQTHTEHPDSGFDWWMFPVNRASASYGDAYHIGLDDVEILTKDPEFMQNYRDGIVLVAKSWGWDVIHHTDVSDGSKHWANYPVRLGKMLQSVTIFQQKDLHSSLVQFIQKAGILSTLDKWILPYLNPI